MEGQGAAGERPLYIYIYAFSSISPFFRRATAGRMDSDPADLLVGGVGDLEALNGGQLGAATAREIECILLFEV